MLQFIVPLHHRVLVDRNPKTSASTHGAMRPNPIQPAMAIAKITRDPVRSPRQWDVRSKLVGELSRLSHDFMTGLHSMKLPMSFMSGRRNPASEHFARE